MTVDVVTPAAAEIMSLRNEETDRRYGDAVVERRNWVEHPDLHLMVERTHSDNNVLVLGPSASGKTTLLDQIRSQLEGTSEHVALINFSATSALICDLATTRPWWRTYGEAIGFASEVEALAKYVYLLPAERDPMSGPVVGVFGWVRSPWAVCGRFSL